MRNRILIWLIGLTAALLLYNEVNAYSTGVHRRLTERTIDLNVQTLNNYLKNIGLPKGVTESVNNREVRKWIEDGSVNEDWDAGGLCTHFYNPLTNLSGVCGESTPSAYEWANSLSNNWSWKAARDYFREGLTLKTKDERGKALATAFEALGHVVHLMQDMAVPAHTRGDKHAIPPFNVILLVGEDSYENYTNKNISGLNYAQNLFGGNTTSVSTGAPRQFWDTDKYNGEIPYSTNDIGLVEYSNANFVSDGTIFKNFPYPKYSTQRYEIKEEPVPPDKKRIYLKKKGEGETIEHFATYGVFSKRLVDPELKMSSLKLDSAVHSDYASLLIPRAVGYSAGLLNYFFRGEMDMEKDKDNPDQYSIKNLSSESMSGDLKLLYDDNSGNRKEVPGGSWAGSAIKPGCKKSGVTFIPPTDAEEPGKYILVLDNGKIGEENGAVAGKVININTMQTSSALTITGSDTPSDGSCYTANGGIEPYQWSITKGSIDTKGCITVTGQCGTATVSVKDACGDTGTKDIKAACDAPLTITGSDTIAKNSTQQYTAAGCCGQVEWSVTGKGATINQGGLLTTDETACRGTITVTAKCPDCNTEASKNVSVSDTCGTLSISGPDTTVKSSTAQYTMGGNCCGDDQVWSVTGTGASISQTGLLTTTGSACGSVKVKASCPSCGTVATKDVRVSDAGQWITVSFCRKVYDPYNIVSYYCIVGKFMYFCISKAYGPGSNRPCNFTPVCTGLGITSAPCSGVYSCGTYCDENGFGWISLQVYEWQCP